MSVSKSSSTRLVTTVGQVVTYVYEISNTGQVALTDVGLTDDNVDAAPFCDFAGDDGLEVAPNPESSVICSAAHTMTAEEMEQGGALENTATATADEAEPAIVSLSIPIGFFFNGFEGPENVITVLDHSNVSGPTSIALGSDGFPVIAYIDHDSDLNTDILKVAKCNDAGCSGGDETASAVDDQENNIFRYASIAIGQDGLPIISYLDGTAVSSSGVTGKLSLAIGADGMPVISYRDGSAGTLKVIHCGTASCQ